MTLLGEGRLAWNEGAERSGEERACIDGGFLAGV